MKARKDGVVLLLAPMDERKGKDGGLEVRMYGVEVASLKFLEHLFRNVDNLHVARHGCRAEH